MHFLIGNSRIVCIVVFITMFFSGYAQSYISSVLGMYAVKVKRYSGSTLIMSCNNLSRLELLSDPNYSDCVYEMDSSQCNGVASPPPYWVSASCEDIKVNADSSMISNSTCGANCAVGKLFANDSIHLRIKSCTISEWLEYDGFKQYSTIGLQELNSSSSCIFFSPQPADKELTIQFFSDETVNSVSIYDFNGKVVTADIKTLNNATYRIDTEKLESGIYVISLKTNNRNIRKKAFIMR